MPLLKLRHNFPSLSETTWWVGFTDNPQTKRWWQKFTHKGFRHVYLYALAPNESVVIMCMSPGGLTVNFIRLAEIADRYANAHDAVDELFNPTVVIPVLGQIAQDIPIKRFAPFTCVELARALLGIDKQIYTPRSLYRYLVSHRLRADLLTDRLHGKMSS